MENSSLPTDVWNNVTRSSSNDDVQTQQYVANIPYLALKIIYYVIYYVIGTVGIIDNLFVIVVFALFIRITNKVLSTISNELFYASAKKMSDDR